MGCQRTATASGPAGPAARGAFGLLPGAPPSRPIAKACGPVARPGPARCRWRPIKGRRLGFGDPNRPPVPSRRRRGVLRPPPSPSRRPVAVPPCLQASYPPSPSSSHGEHKTRPWRPAGGARPPVPGELRSIEPSLQAGALRIHPRRPSRWHSGARSRLPRGRGRNESCAKGRPRREDAPARPIGHRIGVGRASRRWGRRRKNDVEVVGEARRPRSGPDIGNGGGAMACSQRSATSIPRTCKHGG